MDLHLVVLSVKRWRTSMSIFNIVSNQFRKKREREREIGIFTHSCVWGDRAWGFSQMINPMEIWNTPKEKSHMLYQYKVISSYAKIKRSFKFLIKIWWNSPSAPHQAPAPKQKHAHQQVPIVERKNYLTKTIVFVRVHTSLLGGWTNPFEKYDRQIGFIFPNFRGEHKKLIETTT